MVDWRQSHPSGSFSSQVSLGASTALFQVPSVKPHPRALDTGASRCYAGVVIADVPELQKRIRKLEACLRVHSLCGFFLPLLVRMILWDAVLEMVSGSPPARRPTPGVNDSVAACAVSASVASLCSRTQAAHLPDAVVAHAHASPLHDARNSVVSGDCAGVP